MAPEPVVANGLVGLQPRPGAGLSAGQALGFAASVAVGALWAADVGSWLFFGAVAASTCGVALLTGHVGPQLRLMCTGVVVAAAVVIGSAVARSSLDGLTPPDTHVIDQPVELVADPEPRGAGIRADVRISGQRFEAWFFGPTRGVVGLLLAGESVHVRGEVAPFSNEWDGYRARHVVGRLSVDAAWNRAPADGVSASVNRFRRHLEAGGTSMSDVQRGLFLGFVVGDDRALPDAVVDEFRAAGLSHLTAVSGQNVVFVLALVEPAVARLSRWWRLILLFCVLGWFGSLTRWEPSVMRAIATAGLALTLAPDRNSRAQLQMLGVAVTALLLIDPMLVWSIGFRLSVAATVGIVLLARRLEGVLPGPGPIRRALSVTIAAQLGVAPVQLSTFGPIPLASVPANLCAGVASGALMGWGVIAGSVAGLLPDAAAHLIHLPTRLLAQWVASVAHVCATVPFPHIGWLGWTVCLGVTAMSRPKEPADSVPP